MGLRRFGKRGMMLILRNEPKLLMPVPQWQWRDPSQAQIKDQFGNPGVQTRFRLSARIHDGHPIWRLWFDSRDDADWFLHSLVQWIASGTPIPREDWSLPNVIWGDPALYPELQYDFATVTFLTTTGSNQTYTKPTDWQDTGSIIEGIGGGGGGGVGWSSFGDGSGSGGGGGAYSKIVNFVFSGGSLTYRVGSPGASVSRTSNGSTTGGAGTVTYFNAAADPGAGTDDTKLGAQPGNGGKGAGNAGGVSAAAGGASASGWGTTKSSGGTSGSCPSTALAKMSGGGGAAGPSGAGGNAPAGTTTGGIGGTGDNGTVAAGAKDANGNSGTEWSSVGVGSGAGSKSSAGNGGFTGGNYGGAGSGAAGPSGTITSGAGAQGLIVVTYTPASSGNFFLMFS